jgi:uncharacterized membrane protein
MKKRVFALLSRRSWLLRRCGRRLRRASLGRSFSGRGGFRSSGGSYSRSYGTGRSTYGRRRQPLHLLPSFGWGWGGYGGGFGFGSLIMLAVVAFGVFTVVRSLRRAARLEGRPACSAAADYEDEVAADRAYVYKIQLGLGRSARDIQNRWRASPPRATPAARPGWRAASANLASRLIAPQGLHPLRRHRGHGPDEPHPTARTKMNRVALTERSRSRVRAGARRPTAGS